MKVPKGWELLPLGDLLTVCQYGLSEPTSADGDLPIVGMKDLGDGRVNFANLQVMQSDGVDVAKYRLTHGDILFNRTNSADLVGKTAMVTSPGMTAVFASYLVRLCVDTEKATPEYVNAYLNSPSGQGRVKRLATRGVSQANINPTTLRNHLFVPVPPLGEQRRIAEILGAWDDAIEKVNALIQAKQKLKRALMQQLLTPTRRFPQFTGKWRTSKLSEQFERIQRQVGTENVPVLSITATVGFVDQAEKFSRVIAGEQLERYTLIERGEFAYNKGNSKTYPQGCIYRLDEFDRGAVPHVYFSFRPRTEEAHGEFYKFFFEGGGLNRQLSRVINAGVRNDGLLNLNAEDFFGVTIPVPPTDEQAHIADLLAVLSKQIDVLQCQTTALTTQKRGLMQKLLTGQVRVKDADHDR